MCGGENTSSVNVSSCFYFQAAIGAQALDYAKKTNAGPEAEKLGQQVSSMTALLYPCQGTSQSLAEPVTVLEMHG